MTQSTFATPMERTEEILERAQRVHGDVDHVVLSTSGGTDSLVAAKVFAEKGPEFGFDPDIVFHANTGAGVPQTLLSAMVFAAVNDLAYIEGTPYREKDMLGPRVVANGWPGAFTGSFSSGGHAVEWASRKDRPMDGLYSNLPGKQLWISGARLGESEKRSRNIVDGAIDSKERRPRRVWLSPVHSWSDEEKAEYLLDSDIPVSEAYVVLGHSGECNACSFDDAGLLDDLDLIAPELADALRVLATLVYNEARFGDLDVPAKKLRWGWSPTTKEERDAMDQDDGQTTLQGDDVDDDSRERAETMDIVGCSTESCEDRTKPDWLVELLQEQPERIVDRSDVLAYWNGNVDDVLERFQ